MFSIHQEYVFWFFFKTEFLVCFSTWEGKQVFYLNTYRNSPWKGVYLYMRKNWKRKISNYWKRHKSNLSLAQRKKVCPINVMASWELTYVLIIQLSVFGWVDNFLSLTEFQLCCVLLVQAVSESWGLGDVVVCWWKGSSRFCSYFETILLYRVYVPMI